LIKKNPTKRLAIFLRNAKSGYSLNAKGERKCHETKKTNANDDAADKNAYNNDGDHI
jgi:hypothetical protein